MDTPPAPQRAWRALCPQCGASVDFLSAASASAVCSFCRSTLVRDGEALRRIGRSAELFDDHSPLHLGAAGRYQGLAFTLVGRLQYRTAEGCWNEWHALFDSGRSGWLAEDNGAYVFAFDTPAQGELPAAARLVVGERRVVEGRAWSVASVVRARLQAAEGELPRPPKLQGEFTVAELRNPQDEVGTLDEGDPARPQWSVGRPVRLADLGIAAPAGAAEKTTAGRAFECPGCGASLEVTLATTKSIACGHCGAVVDVSKGVGAELAHFKQANAGDSGLEPLLPLGSTGTLALGAGGPLPWQVVGYLERCDQPVDPDEEQGFWREYLLYNRAEGFAFLVDAEDGWSWVRPIAGAPRVAGERLQHGGVDYRRRYGYTARTTYVLGEFYWRVERGQRSRNIDYEGVGGAHARKRLNCEQTGAELVWSAGETLAALAVAKAFRLPPAAQAALQRDVTPARALRAEGASVWTLVVAVFVVLILANILVDEWRAWAGDGAGRCDSQAQALRQSSDLYSRCVASTPGHCAAQQLQLNNASAEHQRCLDAASRGGWRSGGGSGWSGGGWSSGGHK